jgi:hypothetical protein
MSREKSSSSKLLLEGRPVRLAYQPPVLFSHNKPATSNQPTVLFSQNKSAPAISHQPNEHAGTGCKSGGQGCAGLAN